MKRIILFSLLLIFAATSTLAQEVQLPYPSTTALSYEKNKIYYEGERISKRDCQAFLRLNAQEDIYRQYCSGLRMYNAGWGLMGIGLAIDAATIAYMGWGLYDWAKDYNPECPDMGPGLGFLFTGMIIGGAFLLFEAPAIPLLCVGKKRMQQSIDAYNISLPEPQTAKNYWSIQPTNNGIGLAYHF